MGMSENVKESETDPLARVGLDAITLEGMSLDDLWRLHKRVASILEQRLDHEKQKLEHQLEKLGRKFGGAPLISAHVARTQRSCRNIVIRNIRRRRGQAEVSSRAGSKR